MKKGFTLIELMAVIIVLGIISLIAIPLVDQTMADIRNDSYETQIKAIREGARQWGASNMTLLPTTNGASISVPLEELITQGFVKKGLVNPLTKLPFPTDMPITISHDNGDDIYLIGTDEGGQTSPNVPIIKLNGPALVYVNLNGTYVEQGAVATKGTGSTSLTYTSTIYRDGGIVGSVVTNGLFKYSIVYSVTDGGFTTKAIRNVVIKDTVAPTLTIPANASIARSVTTYDLWSGVSASDNSGTLVDIKIETGLTLGIPGSYDITYRATDNAGNVTTRTRTLTITY